MYTLEGMMRGYVIITSTPGHNFCLDNGKGKTAMTINNEFSWWDQTRDRGLGLSWQKIADHKFPGKKMLHEISKKMSNGLCFDKIIYYLYILAHQKIPLSCFQGEKKNTFFSIP
jgi:hypothetical protein